jgi:sulfatase maturation enzyme AslB (radical SAM superfamily)
MIYVPEQNLHHYKIIPRNGELKLNIVNRCDYPSKTLLIDHKGDCFVCPCETWLPVSVGCIDNFDQLEQVWSNPSAKYLQEDIQKNKLFTHCAVDRCGILDRNLPQEKYLVSINIDESCNLRCPSCRKDSFMISDGPVYETKLQRAKHIVNLLENFDQPCHIIMTGNGDPLASAIMRPLIHNYRPRANHSVRLFTNGLLMEKQLDGNEFLNSVTEFMISIDAGSQEVYEKVRLGGSWKQLIKNFDWLKAHTDKRKIQVIINFVLQRDNFQDLNNFCDLVIKYGWEGNISYLEDWGTWANFSEHDVIGNRLHALHKPAMQALKECFETYHPRIFFGSKLMALVKSL